MTTHASGESAGGQNEQLRATLMAKHHEYTSRVAYIEANLPGGAAGASPQQQQFRAHNQHSSGSSGGFAFPPIPGEDPMAVLNRGSSSPSLGLASSGSSSHGSAYPPSPQPQGRPASGPGSGGFPSSALPYGAPPSTKLPSHQLIKLPAQAYSGEYAVLCT